MCVCEGRCSSAAEDYGGLFLEAKREDKPNLELAEPAVAPCLQVIMPALLTEGIELVAKESLEVTDDVSIIEALGKPVKITGGSYTNIKASAVTMLLPLIMHCPAMISIAPPTSQPHPQFSSFLLLC